jgi:hypothetical protein
MKTEGMKSILTIVALAAILIAASCTKDKESEKFRLLTGHPWKTDSLVAKSNDAVAEDRVKASLEDFRGEAVFNSDGTGSFGKFDGTWRFAYGEENLVIDSDSLDFPLTTNIIELTSGSLKVKTAFPNLLNPASPVNIRLTFIPK